jgi:hypothetical protein
MKRSEALYLRSVVEQAAESLDDKTASTAPTLFRSMKYDGSLIKGGTRIRWMDTVKKAAADLWDLEQNNPFNASTLWEDIAYREGIRIIPDTITAATAFAKGEQGWWKDTLYTSLLDANVHTPKQHPAGWE